MTRGMAAECSIDVSSPTGSLNALLTGFDPNRWHNHRNLWRRWQGRKWGSRRFLGGLARGNDVKSPHYGANTLPPSMAISLISFGRERMEKPIGNAVDKIGYGG